MKRDCDPREPCPTVLLVNTMPKTYFCRVHDWQMGRSAVCRSVESLFAMLTANFVDMPSSLVCRAGALLLLSSKNVASWIRALVADKLKLYVFLIGFHLADTCFDFRQQRKVVVNKTAGEL